MVDVDLFYASSSDGGHTFSTPTRLTAQQSPKINDSFEFGDYNGLDAVRNDVIAIFTDNRNEGGGGGGNDPPAVMITAPANGTTVASGASIAFTGSATDAEDGPLTAGLAWTSNLDGPISTGGSFSAALSDGTHTETASVTEIELRRPGLCIGHPCHVLRPGWQLRLRHRVADRG